MSDPNRRDFLAAAATAAAVTCSCALCPMAAFGQKVADNPDPVDIGTPADYATDGVTDKWAKSNQILVIKNGDRIYAPSAICTHKKAVLRVEDGEIVCPKHDSPFDNEGIPKPMTKDGEDTPAKDPLFRYGVSLNDQGHMIVDKTKKFMKDQWEAPGSFVKVSPA